MKTLLVTYNPGTGAGRTKTGDLAREEHAMCLRAQDIRDKFYGGPGQERIASGFASNWNTTTTDVHRGDKVLLLMQGSQGRGIIREGVVVSDQPFKDRNWNPDGKRAELWYVYVLWGATVELDNPLRTEDLEAEVTEVDWNHILGSGYIIENTWSPEAAARINALWADHFARSHAGTAHAW